MSLKIAIASGKGGAGKTTLATNLARVAARQGRQVAYVDCDVEDPNGALFLRPTLEPSTPVSVPVPQVDHDACNNCGVCGDMCQYSAIAPLGDHVLVFPELCHGCGGCAIACPADAIVERPNRVGVVATGSSDGVAFAHGVLDVGQTSSPPVIRAVRAAAPSVDLTFIDAPPGASCPLVAGLRGCDYVVLVVEPTPFGLCDVLLAAAAVRELRLPHGVVFNRLDAGDDPAALAAELNLPLLGALPYDVEAARAYSRGELLCDALPAFAERFADILQRIETEARR